MALLASVQRPSDGPASPGRPDYLWWVIADDRGEVARIGVFDHLTPVAAGSTIDMPGFALYAT